MPVYQLILSPSDEVDLREIYRYGLNRWGKTRSESYQTAFKHHFRSLKEQPLLGIERPELLFGMRSLKVQNHIIIL